MLKVGIAIDAWKFPVFKKRLKKAGYEFEKHSGITPDTLTLRVNTEDPVKLQKVIQSANDECAKSKAH